MGGSANVLQLLQGLNDWGAVSVLLIAAAVLVGRFLFSYLTSQVSRHIEDREAMSVKINALYSATLDGKGKVIHRNDLLQRLEEIEDRCIPEKCPFHQEMRDNTQATRDEITKFSEEGRRAREETLRRMNEIFGEYQQVSHALLGLVGKYLEVSGGAGGKSTG